MILEHLSLRNFRSHRHLDLDFGPVTAILGDNNSGKTNVIRALRWLLLNEGGRLEEVATYGTKEVSVSGRLASGYTVTRKRSSRQNLYVITAPDGTEETLSQVGNAPVGRVLELTGVGPINVGRGTYDLQFQGLDYPSPLDLAPADLAAVLGTLSGAGQLEVTVKLAASRTREQRAALQQAEKQRESAAGEVARLTGVADLQQAAESLQQAESALMALCQTSQQIDSLLNQWQVVQTTAPPLATVVALEQRATVLAQFPPRVAVLAQAAREADGLLRGMAETVAAHGLAVAATAQAEREFADGLRASGSCPLCGAAVAQ